MVTDTKPKTDMEKLIHLINQRITDCHFTAGSPMFSDAHRMAARAREDELEWVRKNIKRIAGEITGGNSDRKS